MMQSRSSNNRAGGSVSSSYSPMLTAWIRQSCQPISPKSPSVQVALPNPDVSCSNSITAEAYPQLSNSVGSARHRGDRVFSS